LTKRVFERKIAMNIRNHCRSFNIYLRSKLTVEPLMDVNDVLISDDQETEELLFASLFSKEYRQNHPTTKTFFGMMITIN